jgi:hypothetical protein
MSTGIYFYTSTQVIWMRLFILCGEHKAKTWQPNAKTEN